ncbi:MAG: DUF2262 domain-containing protein [Ruminococcus sp.]|nr:DUF2262 domain-containing protein [Ruminococcus sp.]
MKYPVNIGPGTVPEKYKENYEDEPHEYLVLIGGGGTFGMKFGQSPELFLHAYMLGFIDLQTGKRVEGKKLMTWDGTPEEDRTKCYRDYFQEGVIYRVQGIPLKDKDNFYPIKILVKGQSCDWLWGLWEEFNKPVTMQSELFGELHLNKKYGTFYGKFNWLGTEIEVSFNTDEDDDAGCLAHLEEFCRDAERRDKEIRAYAADELTYLANDWRDDDHLDEEITEEDFARRIIISSVEMSSEGDWYVWFDDGDMFAGHSVRVSGDAMGAPNHASMEG